MALHPADRRRARQVQKSKKKTGNALTGSKEESSTASPAQSGVRAAGKQEKITEDVQKEQTNERPQSVSEWVNYLGEHKMGVLAGTLRELNHITRDEEAHVSQLSRIILRDPVLTSRVLKIANSALYKTGSNTITTISRAIVVLGFSVVRDIAISLQVMDAMLSDGTQDELLQNMAESYHSAVQAKMIAQTCSPSYQEEVFIAALLRNIGHAAFLSSGGPVVEEYIQYLRAGVAPKKAADKTIGCDFDRLTLALSRAWSLGDVVTELVAKGANSKSALVRSAVLGEEITQAAIGGWDEERLKSVLGKVAEFTGRSLEDCEADIMHATKVSRSQASSYGADKIKSLIPEPLATVEGEASESKAEKVANQAQKVSRGDSDLQLQIISELNAMVKQGNINLNSTLAMIMEAMHRGIGLDRVALCLVINGKQRVISGKAALGIVEPDWEQKMSFPGEGDNIFAYALRYGEPLWMGTKNSIPLSYLITKSLTSVVGKGQFFIAPFGSPKKTIGLFYADNRPSGDGLDEEMFINFKLFVKQAEMAVKTVLARK